MTSHTNIARPASRPAPRPARASRAFTPSVSSAALEHRELLAGAIFFTGGTLNLYAGSGASVATLDSGPNGTVVATMDGESQVFTADQVKLVVFYADGEDSFVNNTNETTISDLNGAGNSVQGGVGVDYVVDYSGTADVDDLGGGMLYAHATQGHGYAVRMSRSGEAIVRLT